MRKSLWLPKVAGWIQVFFRRVVARLPRIYIGCAPKDAPEGSWILLPYNPNILRCGLAAILEIKKGKSRGEPGNFERLLQREEQLATIAQWMEATIEGEKFLDVLEKSTMLRDDASFCAVAQNPSQQKLLRALADNIGKVIEKEEGRRDPNILQETRNAFLVRLKDIQWAIEKEFFQNQEKIREFLKQDLAAVDTEIVRWFRHLNSALNIIERLEIRGRDSAGLAIEVSLPEAAYQAFLQKLPGKEQWFCERLRQTDLIAGTIRHLCVEGEHRLTFVAKVASEIGRLGENVQKLRDIVKQDDILYAALFSSAKRVRYLAHTRWASNGIINIFNCHPMDNEIVCPEDGRFQISPFPASHPHYRTPGHIFAVLNGDIDNYEKLKENHPGISQNITTDTKIIPLEIERHLHTGLTLDEAFQKAVNNFEGSHAIVMQSDLEPTKIFLALKGSGQAIYVGLALDRYVVASEVYGVVEDTDTYLAMEGGQIFVLHEDRCGLHGIDARSYNGEKLTLSPSMLRKAEITTRDIDREDFPHYFLKEISHAPISVEKTMEGKWSVEEGRYSLNLDNIILPNPDLTRPNPMPPKAIFQALAEKRIGKIYCIGQGTASIAAAAIAYQMSSTLVSSHVQVFGLKASELSGFHLREKMHDTLVIAVTQSGTTTDTNKAIAMAKERGAAALAIVNRRNSHVTRIVDGVFYTSDGRDIEMSVASTKAFYSQVAAGEILSLILGESLGVVTQEILCIHLTALARLPDLLRKVLGEEKKIAELAHEWAPKYQHWAVVGSGANRIAADEIRIKLSELCYKSIACDCVEDKKHIDLSSEPLVLVCAAGAPLGVLGDLVKDVSIFKAHKSAPIVIVEEREQNFAPYAFGLIHIPKSDPLSSLILNTMAGHLFGYHAACSIHAQAQFFSTLRVPLVERLSKNSWSEVLTSPEIQQRIADFLQEFQTKRRAGVFTAALSPSTCADIPLLLLQAAGKLPPSQFTQVFGQSARPENIGNALLSAINRAFNELSRPIDAIKHQAKTVTVGTSRFEFRGLIFESLKAAGVSLESLRNDILWRLLQVQPAIESINGYSYYEIRGLTSNGEPVDTTLIRLLKRIGIAQEIPSRSAEAPVPLVGTKRAVIQKSKIFLGLGLRDNRPILIIPIGEGMLSHLILFHITFARQLELQQIKALLSTGTKYADIRNIVEEPDISWKDDYLKLLTPEFLAVHDAREIAAALVEKIKAWNTKNF